MWPGTEALAKQVMAALVDRDEDRLRQLISPNAVIEVACFGEAATLIPGVAGTFGNADEFVNGFFKRLTSLPGFRIRGTTSSSKMSGITTGLSQRTCYLLILQQEAKAGRLVSMEIVIATVGKG